MSTYDLNRRLALQRRALLAAQRDDDFYNSADVLAAVDAAERLPPAAVMNRRATLQRERRRQRVIDAMRMANALPDNYRDLNRRLANVAMLDRWRSYKMLR
jgi:hypothetical protein